MCGVCIAKRLCVFVSLLRSIVPFYLNLTLSSISFKVTQPTADPRIVERCDQLAVSLTTTSYYYLTWLSLVWDVNTRFCSIFQNAANLGIGGFFPLESTKERIRAISTSYYVLSYRFLLLFFTGYFRGFTGTAATHERRRRRNGLTTSVFHSLFAIIRLSALLPPCTTRTQRDRTKGLS